MTHKSWVRKPNYKAHIPTQKMIVIWKIAYAEYDIALDCGMRFLYTSLTRIRRLYSLNKIVSKGRHILLNLDF